jgi:hypothetical protein
MSDTNSSKRRLWESEPLSDQAAEQALSELLDGALEVCCWHALLRPGEHQPTPLIHAPAGGRPDLADLARVFRAEDVHSRVSEAGWEFVVVPGRTVGVYAVELEGPVRCRFKVAVRLAQHRDLLQAAAAAGQLGLEFGDNHPQAGETINAGALMTCRARAIETVLADPSA